MLIENEPLSIGRIDVKEMLENPDIVTEKLDAHIKALLEKYGHTYTLKGFHWEAFGGVSADMILVKKPVEPQVQ